MNGARLFLRISVCDESMTYLKYLAFDRIRELEFSRKNGLEASLVSIGSKVKVTLRL